MITVSSVANATKSELTCIAYEICLEHIQKAVDANQDEREQAVAQAVETIKVLSQGLSMEIPLAREIFRIYVYVQGLLIKEWRNVDKIKEAYRLIHIIYEGYLEVAKQDTSKVASIQNAESVYAGITYGKTDLNEIVLQDKNRGFKA